MFELPPLAPELALYSIDGDFDADGEKVAAHKLVLLAPGHAVRIVAGEAAVRLMVLGGEALDGHRLMWWNFVSSRKARILEASNDWTAQTMGHVPGETELIPLPEVRFNAA